MVCPLQRGRGTVQRKIQVQIRGERQNHVQNYHAYNHYDDESYSHNEFKPFDIINDLVDKNCNANANFANRIISYFNKTYNVSVPVPKIDEKTLHMGFRPVYETYVDMVIEHLGGKSFRETAEEELLKRFCKRSRLPVGARSSPN